MLKRKISLSIAIPLILAVTGIGIAMANNMAESSSKPKPAKVWSNEECLSCHVNKNILGLMQSKRGDSTFCQAAFDRLMKDRGMDPKKDYGSRWKK